MSKAENERKTKPSSLTVRSFVVVFVLVRGFETEEQFEKHVRTDPQSHQILAAVIFEHPFTHDDEPLPLQVKGITHTHAFLQINIGLAIFLLSSVRR